MQILRHLYEDHTPQFKSTCSVLLDQAVLTHTFCSLLSRCSVVSDERSCVVRIRSISNITSRCSVIQTNGSQRHVLEDFPAFLGHLILSLVVVCRFGGIIVQERLENALEFIRC